ncbi:MAG: hypothetical protein M0C28_29360 [Candidatus Moduliflexus flocculans]|nr:hypothetical protein [Candidatus Moduliflexus flocculans]
MDNRLGLVKRSLELLVEQLERNDTVSIVVYGTDARVVLDPTPGSDKDAILSRDLPPPTRRRDQRRSGHPPWLQDGTACLQPRRHQPRHPVLGRSRQRRQHRSGRDPRRDPRSRGGRRDHDDHRLRHGQLQRHPHGAARRQRRRLLRLRGRHARSPSVSSSTT